MAGAIALPAENVLYQDHQTRPSQSQDVRFTRQQLELLERVFSEVVHGPEMSEAQLRHTLGQRSVVAFIRSKVTG